MNYQEQYEAEREKCADLTDRIALLDGSLEEQDFALWLQTDGYDVYLDNTVYMWTIEEVESIWNPKQEKKPVWH